MQVALDQEQAAEHAALDTGEQAAQGPQHPLDLLSKEVVVGVDLEVRAVGPHRAHLQVYTYNDLFREEVERVLGPLGSLLPGVKRRVLGRLLLIQGYLHSDQSPRIRLVLRRGIQGRPPSLELAGQTNPRTRPALAALRRRLWAERSSMKAFPLGRFLRGGEPGRVRGFVSPVSSRLGGRPW